MAVSAATAFVPGRDRQSIVQRLKTADNNSSNDTANKSNIRHVSNHIADIVHFLVERKAKIYQSVRKNGHPAAATQKKRDAKTRNCVYRRGRYAYHVSCTGAVAVRTHLAKQSVPALGSGSKHTQLLGVSRQRVMIIKKRTPQHTYISAHISP